MPRKRDIEAAIAAYNSTDERTPLLPPDAARLLVAMFSQSDVCRWSARDSVAHGFDARTTHRLLRALVAAGFLSKDRGGHGFITTYHLLLPPQAQP